MAAPPQCAGKLAGEVGNAAAKRTGRAHDCDLLRLSHLIVDHWPGFKHVPHPITGASIHVSLDHHLTKKARREHLRAQQDHHYTEQQQRPVSQGVAEHDLLIRQPQADQEAGCKCQRAERAEEMHWPSGKARQEDGGDEEEAEASLATEAELRASMLARMVDDRLLADPVVSLPLGK